MDWGTLDIDILCGYFAPQSSSPHQTLINSLSFSVASIIFQWMLFESRTNMLGTYRGWNDI